MAAVIVEMKEENVTMAKRMTHTVKPLSTSFSGTTSMEAGVNCVIDQCKAVKYRYENPAFCKRFSCTQVSSRVMSKVPMPYQEHAGRWLIT